MGNTLSSNYVDRNGVVHGHLRSFRRTNEQPVWEDTGDRGTSLRANPALNGGVGSWSEMDATERRHLAGADEQARRDLRQHAGGQSDPGPQRLQCGPRMVLTAPAACTHGCASPVQITGPVTTAAFPAFAIYDPDQLIAVRNGTVADYTVDPAKPDRPRPDLPHPDREHQGRRGAAKTIRGFYFDPVRKYLFILAPQSDDSRGSLGGAHPRLRDTRLA